MKKNKKIIIGSVVASVLIILISTIVLALFTSKQEETAKINIGNLDVILEEDWSPEEVPEIGIERNTKTVWGKSVADKKSYVRMRFIPVIEYYYEAEENGTQIAEWRTAPISQSYIKLTVDTHDNWVKQGEYYYYKRILNPKEVTESLNLSWEIVEVPSTIKDYKIRTDVRVVLEYSQVSNEVWKTIFQIDNLPEGVER